MPTITEQEEENDNGIAAREEVMTPDKDRLQEQFTEKPKVEAGLIPVVEPLFGEQDHPMDEEGEYYYKNKVNCVVPENVLYPKFFFYIQFC